MDFKWIGAVLIVTGCSGFGFSLAAAHRREENCLRSLLRALDYTVSELHFHVPALPELCRGAADVSGRGVDRVFLRLAEELEACTAAEVRECMETALKDSELPAQTLEQLRQLGLSLGRFDLDGQLKGLESTRGACRQCLQDLTAHREIRLRNYQTLGLCAGAALAIVLI